MATAAAKITQIGPVTNGAKELVNMDVPYVASVTIEGVADLIFHGWNVEAIDEKAKSKKGSEQKKSDNVESYVYRNDAGIICLPGSYLIGSIVHAAKFRQDPRSPRKSAMDLFKAGVVPIDILCPVVTHDKKVAEKWDYEHRCRVTVQRAGITRTRPAFKAGWSVTCHLQTSIPEYVSPAFLLDVAGAAGKLVGVGDNRPTYGRFQVTNFTVVKAED